ncbi:hypothetical protein NUU61_009200 [Penicillium alfredii]|uniref:Uncharacterized protein n=1 Tax=Penicillium alfredii TaxID=1506179 RepID=A0A9W9EMN8_9EURO|nr:uncharacterized protein NUU61_009200 [Penicillium alfredii]KAJ5084621.1 hypothetical protein NUU61_009200 [Penicillium alfredii]
MAGPTGIPTYASAPLNSNNTDATTHGSTSQPGPATATETEASATATPSQPASTSATATAPSYSPIYTTAQPVDSSSASAQPGAAPSLAAPTATSIAQPPQPGTSSNSSYSLSATPTTSTSGSPPAPQPGAQPVPTASLAPAPTSSIPPTPQSRRACFVYYSCCAADTIHPIIRLPTSIHSNNNNINKQSLNPKLHLRPLRHPLPIHLYYFLCRRCASPAAQYQCSRWWCGEYLPGRGARGDGHGQGVDTDGGDEVGGGGGGGVEAD